MEHLSPVYSLDTLRLRPPESLAQVHVRVRIPKSRHPDPVISDLINRYGLKVNILGALLGTNGQEDGWFDLELNGKAVTVCNALVDLVEMEADIWFDKEAEDGF
jgi:hypothetical protein